MQNVIFFLIFNFIRKIDRLLSIEYYYPTMIVRLPNDLQCLIREFLPTRDNLTLLRVCRLFAKFVVFKYEPLQVMCSAHTYVHNVNSQVIQREYAYTLYSRLPYHPYGYQSIYDRVAFRNRTYVEIILHNEFNFHQRYRIRLYRPYVEGKNIKSYLLEFDKRYDIISKRMIWW